MRVAGTTVSYKLVLPNGYDTTHAYPAILVFGGGPQTMNTIEGTLARNFQAEAEQRGYIVIGPAAPDGDLFFYDGDRIFPEFLDNIRAAYKIDGGKFHVAGPSNGGIAAMHVAAKHPEHFLSATAFPGYLWEPTEAKLRKLEGPTSTSASTTSTAGTARWSARRNT
jgi:dipeptidyl aminopeptidase/acylaminoacyl peptidase